MKKFVYAGILSCLSLGLAHGLFASSVVGFQSLSPSELIQLFHDERMLESATRELITRHAGENPIPNSARNFQLVVCPQQGDAPPLYVVLYDAGYESVPSPAMLHRLFPDIVRSARYADGVPQRWISYIIFAEDGAVRERWGALFARARIADLNGDGIFELAGGDSNLFEMWTIEASPRNLLSVLYNTDETEWSWQFNDFTESGFPEIEFGPIKPGGILPKIRYAWNANQQTYVGPNGDARQHFLRIHDENEFHDTDMDIAFPLDSEAVIYEELSDEDRRGTIHASEEVRSFPYQKAPLSHFTHQEVIDWMGIGKSAATLDRNEIPASHMPERFWETNPTDMALALAEVNRYDSHRTQYALAIERTATPQPDEIGGSILFHAASSGCHGPPVEIYYGLTAGPSSLFTYISMHEDEAFSRVRVFPVSSPMARHIKQVIKNLFNIHSHLRFITHPTQQGFSLFSSTGAVWSTLTLFNAEGWPILCERDQFWGNEIAEFWRRDYDNKIAFQLAGFLLTQGLPALLNIDGDIHELFEAGNDTETRQTREGIDDLLGLYEYDATAIPTDLVIAAIRLVGALAFDEFAPRIMALQSRMPATTTLGTPEKIRPPLSTPPLDPIITTSNQNIPLPPLPLPPPVMDDVPKSPEDTLQESMATTLLQLEVATNSAALLALVKNDRLLGDWALRRLKRVDTNAYNEVLIWRALHTDRHWERQHARSLLAESGIEPPPEPMPAILQTALNEKDVDVRIQRLMECLENSQIDLPVRCHALDLLVPEDNPLFYNTPLLNERLLQYLPVAPVMLQEHIALKLLKRKALSTFDTIEKILSADGDYFAANGLLYAFCQFGEVDSSLRSRIIAFFRDNLQCTQLYISHILVLAWLMDYRELQPDIERLGTSSPEDVESMRAYTYGSESRSTHGERFHVARQIASIWNEQDALTRFRLIAAFGAQISGVTIATDTDAFFARTRRDLEEIYISLSADEQKIAIEFMDYIRTAPDIPKHFKNRLDMILLP